MPQPRKLEILPGEWHAGDNCFACASCKCVRSCQRLSAIDCGCDCECHLQGERACECTIVPTCDSLNACVRTSFWLSAHCGSYVRSVLCSCGCGAVCARCACVVREEAPVGLWAWVRGCVYVYVGGWACLSMQATGH